MDKVGVAGAAGVEEAEEAKDLPPPVSPKRTATPTEDQRPESVDTIQSVAGMQVLIISGMRRLTTKWEAWRLYRSMGICLDFTC